MIRLVSSVLSLSMLAVPAIAASPQAGSPTSAPRYLKVSAPFAQQPAVTTKAAHPEIKKLGLHTVPPGEQESCIIANPIASKIGKISSAADLTVVTSGEAAAYPHPEEGGFFDLGLPLNDAQGAAIGLMVLEIPYSYASTKEEALTDGLKIRDEVAAKIPNKAALFGPAAAPTSSNP